MKAVRIHRFGGPEVMQFDDIARPEPGPGEVLVKVRAASVNPVDFKTREGSYPAVTEAQLPVTLGRDMSGDVEQLGTGVSGLAPGDPLFALLDKEHGAFAEFVIVKARDVARKPQNLDYVHAAAVPLAALTAWQGLFDHGGLRAGQRVLIHGGAGGVGHFAVQFARDRGAEVYTTVGAEELDFVRGLGADRAIDYTAERFEDCAQGVDMVFDLIGGETRARSWDVLKKGGVLVSTLGAPEEQEARAHNVRGTGYMAAPDGDQLSQIAQLIETGKVRPVVTERYLFRDAARAEEEKKQGHVHGKIVLEMVA